MGPLVPGHVLAFGELALGTNPGTVLRSAPCGVMACSVADRRGRRGVSREGLVVDSGLPRTHPPGHVRGQDEGSPGEKEQSER